MSVTTTIISEFERDLRARVVAEAAHSSEMEDLVSSPDFRADAAAYVEGTFDADELLRRTRARYGLE